MSLIYLLYTGALYNRNRGSTSTFSMTRHYHTILHSILFFGLASGIRWYISYASYGMWKHALQPGYVSMEADADGNSTMWNRDSHDPNPEARRQVLSVPKICLYRAFFRRILHIWPGMNTLSVWVRIWVGLHNLQVLFQSLGTKDNRTVVKISFASQPYGTKWCDMLVHGVQGHSIVGVRILNNSLFSMACPIYLYSSTLSRRIANASLVHKLNQENRVLTQSLTILRDLGI